MASHVEALVAFARGVDPEHMASVAGVPEADLQRVEALCRARLPSGYREFLRAMGRRRSRFILVPDHEHDFDTICRWLPTRAYPIDRFFKIAVATETFVREDGSAPDWFLDLQRSDGIDAPIVELDTAIEDDVEVALDGEFREGDVHPLRLAFLEVLTRALFRFLVIERLRYDTTLRVPDEARAVLDALAELGFVACLPALPGVWCFERGRDGGAIVSDVGLGVSLTMASSDPEVRRAWIARFPRAKMISGTYRSTPNTRNP